VDYGPWNPETSSGSSVSYDTGTGAITLALSSAGGYTAWSRAVHDDTIPANRELAGSVALNGTEEKYASVWFRGDADWGGTNDQMVDGWRILWWLGPVEQWALQKRVAGVETNVHGPVAAATDGTTQNYKIRADGTDIRVKVWTGTEPTDWLGPFDGTDLATQARVGVSLNGGPDAVAGRNVVFSAITDSAPSELPAVPELVQELGSLTSMTSTGSLGLTFSGANKPAAGDWIVIRCARNNVGNDPATGDSISTTPGGETYTRVARAQPSGTSSAAAGIVGAMFVGQVGTTWPAGDNLIVWSCPTVTAKAMHVEHWRNLDSVRASSAGSGGGAAGSASATTGAALAAGDVALGMLCFEYGGGTITGDSDTTNGTWSTQLATVQTGTSGNATTRLTYVSLTGQYKVVTGAGTQTYNGSNSVTSSVDAVALVIGMVPA
jgi:hypothetical protein